MGYLRPFLAVVWLLVAAGDALPALPGVAAALVQTVAFGLALRPAEARTHARVLGFGDLPPAPIARRQRDHEAIDRPIRKERTQGPRKHGPPEQGRVLLGRATAETLTAPGRRDDRPAAHRGLHLVSACAVRFSGGTAAGPVGAGGTTW